MNKSILLENGYIVILPCYEFIPYAADSSRAWTDGVCARRSRGSVDNISCILAR